MEEQQKGVVVLVIFLKKGRR